MRKSLRTENFYKSLMIYPVVYICENKMFRVVVVVWAEKNGICCRKDFFALMNSRIGPENELLTEYAPSFRRKKTMVQEKRGVNGRDSE